jgi:hypothetical protein
MSDQRTCCVSACELTTGLAHCVQVASVVGLICAGIYPVVVVPLQIAYGGAERPVSGQGSGQKQEQQQMQRQHAQLPACSNLQTNAAGSCIVIELRC